jgi:hypothetical protein
LVASRGVVKWNEIIYKNAHFLPFWRTSAMNNNRKAFQQVPHSPSHHCHQSSSSPSFFASHF